MPSQGDIVSETHIVNLRAYGVDLETYIKCYRRNARSVSYSSDALSKPGFVTLVLMHGLGGGILPKSADFIHLMHGLLTSTPVKELWEPTIIRLFELEKAAPGVTPTIFEIWSIDGLDNGESASLNGLALKGQDTPICE